ncbi:MAG: DMT family transporter [Oscillospiraceae bacterium]
MDLKKVRSSLLLLLTAIIWGVAFVSQSEGMQHMGAFTFSAARSILGFVVLLPVIAVTRARAGKSGDESKRRLPVRTTIIGGLCCGLALTAASLLQQFGVSMTTVGKSGFITAMYIIFTPILGVFIGRKAPVMVWVSAALGAVGLYLLCMNGEEFSLSTGDLLVLLCAVMFAVHILVIDHFSPQTDGVVLSCIQFFVCFVISLVCALIFEQPSFQQIQDGAVSVLYAGVMSSGVAYTLQIVGQKGLDPTVAALILSLESVVATIAGYIAYLVGFLDNDQTMTARQIAGCGVVFAAVILVQLPWEKMRGKKAE